MIYSNTTVYGVNEYGKSGHLYIYFYFFEALNDASEVQFFQGIIST